MDSERFLPDPEPIYDLLPDSVRIQCWLLFNSILSGSNKIGSDQLKTSRIRIDNTNTWYRTWSWRYCRWWIPCGELGGAGDMAASSTGGIIHPLATLLRSPYKTVWKFKKFMTGGQSCGSGMFIPDPDFYPSRIRDPKTATKERGEKNFNVIPYLFM